MNWISTQPDSWDGKNAIILAHGAGQGMDSPFMGYFHTELARRGLVSVKFNFEYMEKGRKIPDPQPKLQERYRSVISEVLKERQPERLFIGGKSLGGRVASYVAADCSSVQGLIFLGYPLHPPGRPNQLRDDHLYQLKIPMLFITGTKDIFAERNLLDKVVRKLRDRATLVWIKGGDHSLRTTRSGEPPLQSVVDAIERWVNEVV